MTTKSLVSSLYQIGVVQFGEFTLKSGQASKIYMNLRKIISYPEILRQVSDAMWEKTHTQQFDLVCGVPYTALPIATCMSLDHNIPMIMRRKEKKEYGTKQSIEGVYQSGQSCLIIEDVVTTGGSIFETAADLEAQGLSVKDVVALIDREQGGREALEAKFTFHPILTLSDILEELYESPQLPPSERSIVEQLLMARSA